MLTAAGLQPFDLIIDNKLGAPGSVELLAAKVEIARAGAEEETLPAEFLVADVRGRELEDRFDFVLSLNDGAIGYLPTEEENDQVLETVASALRSRGRHLAQLPNVLDCEAHRPPRAGLWAPGHLN